MQRRIRNGRAPGSFSWQVKHFCRGAWVPFANVFWLKHGWGEEKGLLCVQSKWQSTEVGGSLLVKIPTPWF